MLLQFHELLLSITAFPCPFLAETHPCLFVLLYVLAFAQARGRYNEWILDRVVAWTEEEHGGAVNVKFFVCVFEN